MQTGLKDSSITNNNQHSAMWKVELDKPLIYYKTN